MNILKRLSAIGLGLLLTVSATFNVFGAEAEETMEKNLSMRDASMVQKYITSLAKIDEKDYDRYDFDGDGKITIQDAVTLQKFLIGLINRLPNKNYDGDVYIPDSQPTEPTEPTTSPVEPTTSTEPTAAKEATYIELNHSELNLGASEVLYLSASTDDEQGLSWTSSNASVISVDQYGKINALKTGTAEITCKTSNNLTAVCKIKVYPMASSLTLNASELRLGIGEQYDLDSYVNKGSYAYIRDYYSDNESVAEVQKSGGLVTAKGVGTANVICVLQNGVKATCKVAVGEMPSYITLNAESISLGVGDTFDFDSTVPSGTIARYRYYYSEDSEIASIQKAGGLLTANKVGTTRIFCELNNGVRAYADVNVLEEAPTSVSLNANSLNKKVGDTYELTATTNNGTGLSTIDWTSDSPNIVKIEKASGNKCTIKAMSLGTATITAKTLNGKTAECRVSIEGSNVKCIDISTWQNDVDFNKVKAAGYDYVIIRAGYGRETYQKDNMFESHYANAKKAGLKVGVYWFSYADSVAEAKIEAQTCLKCIGNKQLDLPVYYDLEYEQAIWYMSSDEFTEMALEFCRKIEKAGYKSGIYSSASVWQGSPLNHGEVVSNNVSVWNAQWSSRCDIECDLWQYTETGSVDGIYGDVDISYVFNLNIVSG